MKSRKHILAIIIIAQFFCTSLWFAGNAILDQLTENLTLVNNALANITIAVQLGFIVGTFIFALFTLADRYPPSRIFFYCATLGALCNLGLLWSENTIITILTIRFFTGFFLAGIYPIGMKIAADYYEEGLGKSLSLLVGALVLGTALPHIINSFPSFSSPQLVIITTSTLSIIGGSIMLLLVPKGPYSISQKQFKLGALKTVFSDKNFNKAALGYFGHMWELYAFWTYIPILITYYISTHQDANFNISLMSFSIIAIGSLGCIIGGTLSSRFESKKIAILALSISGFCCLISPFIFQLSPLLFIIFLIIWGLSVIADSPLFSSLVANNTTPQLKGTALTIVNCIGFSITIISIQMVSYLSEIFSTQYLLIPLAIGPLIGLLAMRKFR